MAELIFLIFGLLTTHVICDFWLQPAKWVRRKYAQKYRSPTLIYHALLHGFAAVIPILFVTHDIRDLFSAFVIIGVTHWAIDLWKVYQPSKPKFFIIDQLLHSLVLVLIAAHTTGHTPENFIGLLIVSNNTAQIMAVAFAYILITKPSSAAIGLALKKYSEQLKRAETDADGKSKVRDLLEGGQLIGYLERILILTFTLQGSYAAVGFVLASKSVFRFGELNNVRDRAATEYVLIGSMLSVTLTVLLGIITTTAIELLG